MDPTRSMSESMRRCLLAFALVVLILTPAAASDSGATPSVGSNDVPTLGTWVNDYATLLNATELQDLNC